MSETFLVVRTGEERQDATNIGYIEAKYTQNNSLQQRIIQPQMSVVLRLRNPAPGQHAFSSIPSKEDRIYVPEFPEKKKKSGLEQFDVTTASQKTFSLFCN